MLSIFWIFVELLCFPDLTQGKAVINKKIYAVIYNKEIYEVIYNEKIYEAIYDKKIYEAIYLPVDDDDATLEGGQDKWGNVCVFVQFCHIDNNLSS